MARLYSSSGISNTVGETMRLSTRFAAATLAVSAAFASPLQHAAVGGAEGISQSEALVGAWKPVQARTAGWALLVFESTGRFSMLAVRAQGKDGARFGDGLPSFPEAVREPQTCNLSTAICHALETLSGLWTLGADGGEVVLTFERWKAEHPTWTRSMTLLLAGDELRPYPGMRGRSPIASTPWLKIEKGFGRRLGM